MTTGVVPGAGDVPATMQVDYVRVYKAEGDTTATISGTGLGETSEPSDPQPSVVAVTGISMDQKEVTLNEAGQTTTLTKTIHTVQCNEQECNLDVIQSGCGDSFRGTGDGSCKRNNRDYSDNSRRQLFRHLCGDSRYTCSGSGCDRSRRRRCSWI